MIGIYLLYWTKIDVSRHIRHYKEHDTKLLVFIKLIFGLVWCLCHGESDCTAVITLLFDLLGSENIEVVIYLHIHMDPAHEEFAIIVIHRNIT